MSYNKADLEKQALEAIDKYNILFIEEVVAWLPCTRATFYNKKLHESRAIKEAIENKRILTRQSLKKKWNDSDSPALQIAFYKLICSDQELDRLSGGKQKHDVSFPNGLPAEVVQIMLPENGRDKADKP
jgi:hypothetical protein